MSQVFAIMPLTIRSDGSLSIGARQGPEVVRNLFPFSLSTLMITILLDLAGSN